MDETMPIIQAAFAGLVMAVSIGVGVAAILLRKNGDEPVRRAIDWTIRALIFLFLGTALDMTSLILDLTSTLAGTGTVLTFFLGAFATLFIRLAAIQVLVAVAEVCQGLLTRGHRFVRWILYYAAIVEVLLAGLLFALQIVEFYQGLFRESLRRLNPTFDLILLVAFVGALGFCAHLVMVSRKDGLTGMTSALLILAATSMLLYTIVNVVYDFLVLAPSVPNANNTPDISMSADLYLVMKVTNYVFTLVSLLILVSIGVLPGKGSLSGAMRGHGRFLSPNSFSLGHSTFVIA